MVAPISFDLKKLKIQSACLVLVFLIFFGIALFSLDYEHRRGVANSLVVSIRSNLLVHDLRSAMLSLEVAGGSDFYMAEFISHENTNDRFAVNYNNFVLFPAQFVIPISFGVKDKSPEFGKIIFTYDLVHAGKYFLVVIVFAVLFGMFMFSRAKKSILFKYEEALLKQEEKIIVELAKQVAHDIRSPLTALQLVLQNPAADQALRNSLISGALNRIKTIADDLMGKSKLCSLEVFNVDDALEEVLQEKRVEFGSSIEFECDFNSENHNLTKANRSKLQRVFSNVLNNAKESIFVKRGLIKVSITHENEKILISISDNGHGIPDEVIQNVENRRISIGKTGTDDGHGLGLYDAFQAISSWGGKITLRRLSVGSEVLISLNRFKAH